MKPGITEIIIIGSDGCYSKCEIDEKLLDSIKTYQEKGRFIGETLTIYLESMDLERKAKRNK